MKTNEQEHLPVMGIGPVCIAIMIAFTAAGITAVKFDLLTSGNVRSAIIAIVFVTAGILCIGGGIALWCAAVFGARIDITIKANQLATDGVYALVRNPIYSAFLFICTGSTAILPKLVCIDFTATLLGIPYRFYEIAGRTMAFRTFRR